MDLAITITAGPPIVIPNVTSILIPAGFAAGVRQVQLPPGLDIKWHHTDNRNGDRAHRLAATADAGD